MTAAPTNWLAGVYCGQASRQHPQLMHRDSGYRSSCNSLEMDGPVPRSYVPSMGIHALTRLRSLNSRWRSTNRSRTRGNLVIGSSVIAPSTVPILSTSAEQAWRVRPLMSIVQAPHTSSRHPLSQTGDVVSTPSVVTGWAAMYWRHEMTFMFGRWGT